MAIPTTVPGISSISWKRLTWVNIEGPGPQHIEYLAQREGFILLVLLQYSQHPVELLPVLWRVEIKPPARLYLYLYVRLYEIHFLVFLDHR